MQKQKVEEQQKAREKEKNAMFESWWLEQRGGYPNPSYEREP